MATFKKKSFFPFIFALCLCACERHPPGRPIYSQKAFIMDTLVEFQVAGGEEALAQKAVRAALKRMTEIDAKMSRFRPDSPLRIINRQAGQEAVPVDKELFGILERGKKWGDITRGAFDITIGAAAVLWDFENKNPPLPQALTRARSLVNYKDLSLQKEGPKALLARRGMTLDLGGIAKGYAVDEAIRILAEHGIGRALVDAGGDMRALGEKKAGRPWKIGLRHPREKQAVIAVIPLSDKAVVTSGDYERCFIKNGTRYHHILDPRTGEPASGPVSVTVISDRAEKADVLSTAIFVLGEQKGLELTEALAGCEALLVTAEGKIITSGGFGGEVLSPRIDLGKGP